MIQNIHERIVAGDPDQVWARLVDLGSLYPSTSGSFELPDGLYPGAPVLHDGTRCVVKTVEPGRRLWFDMGRSLSGGHGFELISRGDGSTLVRHTIQGRPRGLFAVLWPVLVRRQHNRAITGTLDNLARAMASSAAGTST